MPEFVSLTAICEQTGISDRSARRYLEGELSRHSGSWHRFTPDEVPQILALIESKRRRRCLNRFNATPREVMSQ